MSAPAKPDLPLAVRPTRSGAGLLIIAHGERGGAAENSLVHDLVTRLRASSRFARVEAGFIRSEPPLEEAAARLSGTRMTVYPLFMSDGYYVRRAIPERLAASGHAGTGAPSILPPLGLDPGLVPLGEEIALEAVAAAGLESAGTHLLAVAHGSSKSGESAACARSVAAQIEARGQFASVSVAFLEEHPFLEAALKTQPGPAALLGLFAGDGLHAAEDLPGALAASGRRDIVLAGSLGGDRRLADLVAAAITAQGELIEEDPHRA
ncbi:MAG TPA: CbiX/SirB N-terminal domain-containing protein [Hyphomicrobiales bacterium]|nr:CbiX/SirB N-terminal domain-containing protein [Hyphomicrobiales bacterium]